MIELTGYTDKHEYVNKHNLPFVGVELDPDYFRDHCKRFDRYTAQLTLF